MMVKKLKHIPTGSNTKIKPDPPKLSKLTLEIAGALREAKLIREGKMKPLSLEDI